jgi:hypothetical protein
LSLGSPGNRIAEHRKPNGERSALDQYLGQHVSGIMMPGGSVEWSFGRKLDLRL